jgi:type I restriction enzyme S subunit
LSGAFGGADTWKEVPLGDISKITYGYTESAKQQEVGPKFLRITDIQNGTVDWDQVPYCTISREDEKKQKLEPGDIVFARTGATTGKSYLLNNPPRSVCASYLIRLRPVTEEIIPEYLYLYFQSGRYWLSVKAGMSGTAQGGFNSTKLGSMSVLVPALGEQERIIAKVNELIALCDELELSSLERNVLMRQLSVAMIADLAA